MKSYNEIADSVFNRREQFEICKKKRRKIIVRTVTPVCCVCIVAISGFVAWQNGLFNNQPIKTVDDSVNIGEKDWYGPGEEETSANGNNIKPSENTSEGNDFCEIIQTENYVYKIEEGQFSRYFGGKIIATDKIGSKIADVTLKAGWKNDDGSWKSQEMLRGEVFIINGVEENVAAALKFIDKGEAVTTIHYYVIMNPDADLSVVEDYIIPISSNNTEGLVME